MVESSLRQLPLNPRQQVGDVIPFEHAFGQRLQDVLTLGLGGVAIGRGIPFARQPLDSSCAS